MQKSNFADYWHKSSIWLLKLFTNPFFLSFLISLIIILTLPPIFGRHSASVVQRNRIPEGCTYYYADLNNDGSSEKIIFRQLEENFFSFTVLNKDQVIDQWNFNGKYFHTIQLAISSKKAREFRSVYFFSLYNSKIFLNCINPFKREIIFKDKFVSDYSSSHNGIECNIVPIIDYLKGDDEKFYFYTQSSYSAQPRKMFEYDSGRDSIFSSSNGFAQIIYPLIDTVNKEINFVCPTVAVGNTKPDVQYSDMFSWLMDFDNNLSLVNKPIKIGYYPSASSVVALEIGKKKYFACLNIYNGIENHNCSFFLFNSHLELIKKKPFRFSPDLDGAALSSTLKPSAFFYLLKMNGLVEKLDTNFNVVEKSRLPILDGTTPISLDLDNDGRNELIFQNRNKDKIIITEPGSTDYTLVNTPGLDDLQNYSIVRSQSESPYLCISTLNEQYILSYTSNILFFLKYPIYAAIFFVVFLIIALIEKTQKRRAELKYETEKRIAELQLKSIKGQLDPHFTLNIINSIGSLFYKEDKEKADFVFGKYSKLLRSTILNSDKIVTTLNDELEYVENYLELEKFRSGNSFCWEIKIDEDIDRNIKIPKMLVHTFAENAVKHGLRNLDRKGTLLIQGFKNSGEYKLVIRDNGVGRDVNKKNLLDSTGKGLTILNQILDLYFNLMKVRITYNINDLFDADHNSKGTEVIIKVPLN